jgi:hypothetical protein
VAFIPQTLQAVYRILLPSAQTSRFQHGFQVAPPDHDVRRRDVERGIAQHHAFVTVDWGLALQLMLIKVKSTPNPYMGERRSRMYQEALGA